MTVQDIFLGIIVKKKENSMTAQQIADLSGVSKSTVRQYLEVLL